MFRVDILLYSNKAQFNGANKRPKYPQNTKDKQNSKKVTQPSFADQKITNKKGHLRCCSYYLPAIFVGLFFGERGKKGGRKRISNWINDL